MLFTVGKSVIVQGYVGEIAALLAAAGFSVTSVCYTFAGRKINAVTSIALSLPISWFALLGIHGLALGEIFPISAGIDRWFFLSASGVLAFVLSSYFMLNAFQNIGPRLTMLIASFAPVLGALLAWIFLGQRLSPKSAIGIAVVILGIVWVVAERSKAKTDDLQLDLRRGIVNACLGTLAQGVAFVFASQGIAGGFPPLSAALIRITSGMIALWLFIGFQRNIQSTASVFKHDSRLLLQLTGAALFGPVISGSLLLLSFQRIPVGVATTLSHTTSVMLIPIGFFLFKERITPRAIAGTIITVIGIGILFMG
jgi:drug/metabolite transporter (DMT)-like permease